MRGQCRGGQSLLTRATIRRRQLRVLGRNVVPAHPVGLDKCLSPLEIRTSAVIAKRSFRSQNTGWESNPGCLHSGGNVRFLRQAAF
jgi:hypothetical protein